MMGDLQIYQDLLLHELARPGQHEPRSDDGSRGAALIDYLREVPMLEAKMPAIYTTIDDAMTKHRLEPPEAIALLLPLIVSYATAMTRDIDNVEGVQAMVADELDRLFDRARRYCLH